MGVDNPSATSALISAGNSSTAALSGGATFTGIGETNDYRDLLVTLKTDADGTLYVEFSIDGGENYDTSLPFAVTAGVGEFHVVVKGRRTARVRYVNGASPQTYFRMQTEYGQFRQPNSGLSTPIQSRNRGGPFHRLFHYQQIRHER